MQGLVARPFTCSARHDPRRRSGYRGLAPDRHNSTGPAYTATGYWDHSTPSNWRPPRLRPSDRPTAEEERHACAGGEVPELAHPGDRLRLRRSHRLRVRQGLALDSRPTAPDDDPGDSGEVELAQWTQQGFGTDEPHLCLDVPKSVHRGKMGL